SNRRGSVSPRRAAKRWHKHDWRTTNAHHPCAETCRPHSVPAPMAVSSCHAEPEFTGARIMLDQVIRNARIPEAECGSQLVDIGFRNGRIAAIERAIESEAHSYDAQGRLCCAGLVETHIHLDKSRILDRCAPEPSRNQPDHMRRVQAVKSTFTIEDI